MSEYIFEWSDIGSDVTEMVQSDTSPWKVTKVIRHARLREPIVRCRDCNSASFDEFGGGWCNENCREIKAWNFCAWGEKVVE